MFIWPRSVQVRPRSNDTYVPILNSYSFRASRSLLYIFEPAIRMFGLVGLCAMCGSEGEVKASDGLLARELATPGGLLISGSTGFGVSVTSRVALPWYVPLVAK